MRRVLGSRFPSLRSLALGVTLLASTLSCHILDTPIPPTRPVTVINYLIAPVTVSLASAGVANLACCGEKVVGDANLTVSQALWTPPAQVTFPSGTTGIDDLPSSQSFDRLLTIVRDTVLITNTIGPFRYFAVKIDNKTTSPVQIAISRTAGLQCLGTHPASSNAGYWGYWKYLGDTEFRVYRAGTSCTGSFITFDNNTLAASATNSGLVTLTVNALP
jgi:hypothetical protein